MYSDKASAGSRGRILVVDDQPAMAGALTSFVRSLGYEAAAVSDGEQALSEIREAHPSLVLLDLNLGGSNGRELLRLLRTDPSFTSLPVVICTAEDRLGQDDVRALGAQDFVHKSEVFEQLDNVIEMQLRPERANKQ